MAAVALTLQCGLDRTLQNGCDSDDGSAAFHKGTCERRLAAMLTTSAARFWKSRPAAWPNAVGGKLFRRCMRFSVLVHIRQYDTLLAAKF
jgi:hypothetical protein